MAEIVVESAHVQLGEARLRRRIEAKLAKAGALSGDPTAVGARLTLLVSGDHDSTSQSFAHTAYEVRLTVSEPAVLTRDPSTSVRAIVWQRAMRVSSFSKEIPPEAVLDKVEDLLSSFAAAVGAARRTADLPRCSSTSLRAPQTLVLLFPHWEPANAR